MTQSGEKRSIDFFTSVDFPLEVEPFTRMEIGSRRVREIPARNKISRFFSSPIIPSSPIVWLALKRKSGSERSRRALRSIAACLFLVVRNFIFCASLKTVKTVETARLTTRIAVASIAAISLLGRLGGNRAHSTLGYGNPR